MVWPLWADTTITVSESGPFIINPLRYALSQGSKVPCLRPMLVFIMVLWVLVQKTL